MTTHGVASDAARCPHTEAEGVRRQSGHSPLTNEDFQIVSGYAVKAADADVRQAAVTHQLEDVVAGNRQPCGDVLWR
jgi:hypothetical protein